jgi:hypothetical protein
MHRHLSAKLKVLFRSKGVASIEASMVIGVFFMILFYIVLLLMLAYYQLAASLIAQQQLATTQPTCVDVPEGYSCSIQSAVYIDGSQSFESRTVSVTPPLLLEGIFAITLQTSVQVATVVRQTSLS